MNASSSLGVFWNTGSTPSGLHWLTSGSVRYATADEIAKVRAFHPSGSISGSNNSTGSK